MKWLTSWVLTSMLWLAPSGQAAEAQASSKSDKELSRASDLIDALHLDEAEQVLAGLDAEHPDAPGPTFQRSMLAFYRGNYAAAVELSARAMVLSGDDHVLANWRSMHDVQQATQTLTASYVHERSSDGRYVVSFPEGVDRVLLPYAMQTLVAADRALSEVLGAQVPGPIRLEIYPSADALAQVSTLTKDQIQTSGTVALCKWNRLMITSPRALVRGYPWTDTIAHELTHLYISYVTQDRAPVWLQEGCAKLLERRFRDPQAAFVLDPASRTLLERANRDGRLLRFEQLHPSIALLPSQDDAGLAFAQVSTFMDRFVSTHGPAALRAALSLVGKGVDAREALARAADTRFAELERAWRSTLPKAESEHAPRKLARRFRAGHDTAPDESQDVASVAARRFLRLGDLLWSRHHVRGAMLEYDKAHKADADDPIVAARLSRAALDAGDPARSLGAVEPLLARYPEHAPTHAVCGAALLALGREVEARSELFEAVRINPFDPEPHCALARIPGDDEATRIERSACAVLRAP